MKKLSLLLVGIFLYATQQGVNTKDINIVVNATISKNQRLNTIKQQRPYIIKISGIGEGIAPLDTISPAQARALARRAAVVDAYRSLAEKMYGIRLSAKDRIKDLVSQNTEIRSSVYGIIRGARIDSESWKDGLYRVVLIVNLDACRWGNYLTSTSLYKCSKY